MNFSQQIKLFDRNFVTNTLRSHYRCPKCRNEFAHNYQMVFGDAHTKSNRPFLLPCGHNMCENCIYQNRSNLSCNVCLRPVEIPMNNSHQHSQFVVRDFFDTNFFLFGEINFLYFNRRNNSNNNSFHHMASGANMSPQIPQVQKCSECEVVPAVGICKHCKVHFCNLCFDAVHKNSKVLKRHKLHREDKKSPRCVQMPKPHMCQRHRKNCERFCKKCRLICCALCIKSDHAAHGWSTILDENEQTKVDVLVLLETIKNSRDNLKKAQKDVKSTEMQLDEYATQTLLDISKYFVELHSFLQLEECRIVDEFKEMAQRPQEKLREAYLKLGETQIALNEMRSNLEFHQRKPPIDILLHEVITATNTQLEQLPCQVQISKERLTKNPFTFHVIRDLNKDFNKYVRYEYEEPHLSIRIGPIYGDLNRSIQETQSSTEDTFLNIEEHKIRNNKRNQKKKQASACSYKQSFSTTNSQYASCTLNSMSQALTSKCIPAAIDEACALPASTQMQKSLSGDECMARICHVVTPEQFYIQKEDTFRQIRELSHKYVNFSLTDSVPKSISEGNYYMAYYAEDKLWYRALVKKILDKDLFKLFLIDIGVHLHLPKQRICNIDEKSLALPYAAIRCAIHDLMPEAGNCWSDEANQLLVEITQNKPVRVSIMEQIKNNIWNVDLITTHTAEPISLRDSFLYTGLARERPGAMNFKLQPKKMSPVSRISQRLSKQNYDQGEMLHVQMSHVEDPQEFYVVKLDQSQKKKIMWDELNLPGENLSKEPIYLASLQMCCALKSKDVWHRACVEEIKEGGKVRVRLVDEGIHELVCWNQLFVLPDKYREHKEYAMKCALADIEPLQEQNYKWSDDAITQFKQICANPNLQLFIFSVKNGEYKVSLHVNKKHIDINIGAMLVNCRHAVSTGEASQVLEVFKSPKKRLSLPNSAFHQAAPDQGDREAVAGTAAIETKTSSSSLSTTEKPEVKILNRTPAIMRNIESPGEFYVSLKRVEAGIRKFHRQMQERQKERQQQQDSTSDMRMDYKDWFVGDHCIVYTSHNYKLCDAPSPLITKDCDSSQLEYYRGIIITIELEPDPQRPFVVFLRDFGVTVHSIRKTQLHAIDPQIDRVTNAVQRCHLACVQPTGGVTTWSQTSIEFFKRNVHLFKNLGITLQGERQRGSKSLPVVLWGMTTETADPLAPCISKYANINRMLVNAGLAHLVERLDVTKQMDRIMQQELEDGEITIEEWFKNFSENKALKVVENAHEIIDAMQYESLPSELDFHMELETTVEGQQRQEPSLTPALDTTVPTGWLKSRTINKTIFTAYPTYVDFDAIIYLHDADDRDLLIKLRAKIKKLYGQKAVPNEQEIKYRVGQPCLAMYHVDNQLYRVIVKRAHADNEFDVLFIDYGNVERCKKSELRPFVPFPKLPTIASKYRIEGICPKNGEASYPTNVLDIMHSTVVGKLVSVRVSDSELSDAVKSCSIRVGSDDLAHLLVEQGLVEYQSRETDHTSSNELASKPHRVQIAAHYKKLHALPEASDNDENAEEEEEFLELPSPVGAIGEPKQRLRDLLFADIEKQLEIGTRKHVDMDDECVTDDPGKTDQHVLFGCADENDDLDDRFNQYLDHLENEDMELDNDHYGNVQDTELRQQHSMLPPPPPAKKRMFDLEDYKKMHDQLQQEKLYGSIEGSENFEANVFEVNFANSCAAAPANAATIAASAFEEDEDIVELEYSFASNYWHTVGAEDAEDKALKKCRHSPLKLEKTQTSTVNELESSFFDKFLPNETSTVFSHISGIECFKLPKLPTGMRSFFCTVVSILTPTILHIFPHLAELEYRETELDRSIKHLVKSAPPLKQYEPQTQCLACYSKDKKWYRALIRTYNPVTKTADVLYVDYLNTETVSVKGLRQYPAELAAWPLRTFRVKLANLQANPRMRERDVRRALNNVVAGRTLHARIEKPKEQNVNTSDEEGVAEEARRLLEISLYESKKSASSMVIYEELIVENFYCRV